MRPLLGPAFTKSDKCGSYPQGLCPVVRECGSEQEGGQFSSGLGGSSIEDSDDQSIHRPFSVPMAAGLGLGGEQEVHIATEQPGWRNPDSKIGRARTASFVLLCVVFMSMHLALSKTSHL